ncbi:diguanylate cyclase domain-containing protein [Marinobacterium arenosum]|uniref:diguanylate cyclase domain-containing protein n=1 Tax=Marinobacterium arenosum TaxID=2862496 RepID=UPI001C982FC7|nr:diguanylate cyclase [Marinobacterium arenosum]MBY4678472.1 diguanylate cyclase [Marinobacterium arenosum]
MKKLVLKPKYWLLPITVWSALVAASFSWNWQKLDQHTMELANDRARFVFKVIESVRIWNARHGGVYAEVNEYTPPNPYLKVPERDLTTTDGLSLTLLNPAYMTRQLSDIIEQIGDVRIHLTSLKPLNPDNAASPWEAQALKAFEQGEPDRVELVSASTGEVVRYMAPLHVKQECMQCHQHQGYQVGDIRGGLSVSFSAAPLLQDELRSQRNLIALHGGIWTLVCGLLLIGLSQIRRQMLSLRKAKEHLDEQVKQRTAELHTLSKAVEYSPTSTVITDPDGNIEYVNPKFSEVTGYPLDEVLGQNPRLLQSGETDQKVYEQLWQTITGGNIWQGQLHNRKKDGTLYWEQLSISPILDSDGRITHFVALKEDITEHRAQAELIHYQANYDHLTGLPNRKLFHERLRQQIDQARQSGRPFALLFIDLDGFKAINDNFGHDAGDLLLKESARRIADCVRKSDTVARLGGDEFTLILQQLDDPAVIGQIAGKIIKRLRQPFQLGKQQGQVSASIGIARYPEDGSNDEALLKLADSAMYQVKHNGRENYRFCDEVAEPVE